MICRRTVKIPVEKTVVVKFYVMADPIWIGQGFNKENPYVVNNAFFDTREEAEKLLQEEKAKGIWNEYTIYEKIIQILD